MVEKPLTDRQQVRATNRAIGGFFETSFGYRIRKSATHRFGLWPDRWIRVTPSLLESKLQLLVASQDIKRHSPTVFPEDVSNHRFVIDQPASRNIVDRSNAIACLDTRYDRRSALIDNLDVDVFISPRWI